MAAAAAAAAAAAVVVVVVVVFVVCSFDSSSLLSLLVRLKSIRFSSYPARVGSPNSAACPKKKNLFRRFASALDLRRQVASFGSRCLLR